MLSNAIARVRGWLDRGLRRTRMRRLAWLAVIAPALLVAGTAQSAFLGGSVGPHLPPSIGPRAPTLGTVGPRLDPTFHSNPTGGSSVGTSSTGASSSSGTQSTQHETRNNRNTGRSGVPPAGELRFVPDELVVALNGTPAGPQITAFLNRFRLSQLETRNIALINTTFYRLRILDGTTVPAKIRALESAGAVRTVQPNYLFGLVQASGDAATAGATPAQPANAPDEQLGASAEGGDAAQYALGKLHLGQAHALARGDKVLVAIVDSGIDTSHPALTGVVEKSFDALDSSEGPHSHGTAIAGIIAGHARLTGAAPAVRILAARAFSATQGSTVSIIASIDWATSQGARVINMSFAGPSDPALERVLAAGHQKGVVLVAASGNAGPKSPPLWPAADPNVIAVTATDYDDHLYAMANRGKHVAIAAPGVDILVAQPGDGYKIESGTSFSCAFVSGVAALVIERKPQLGPDAVKKVLLATAHDLGPKGRDDLFGAGLMDAFQAVSAVDKPTDAALQVQVR